MSTTIEYNPSSPSDLQLFSIKLYDPVYTFNYENEFQLKINDNLISTVHGTNFNTLIFTNVAYSTAGSFPINITGDGYVYSGIIIIS